MSLSVGRSGTTETRPIPARAPFLRRLWLRFVRILHALSPLLQLLQGALLLAATWVTAAYLTVCFGAPLLSYWPETASFCVLVVLLTAYPCLLVLGPTPSSLHSLYTSGSTDCTPLPATLYLNSVCSLAGAWLGAVPLPLDWDRPWQVKNEWFYFTDFYSVLSQSGPGLRKGTIYNVKTLLPVCWGPFNRMLKVYFENRPRIDMFTYF